MGFRAGSKGDGLWEGPTPLLLLQPNEHAVTEKEDPLTYTNRCINDAYEKLCKIMRHPQEFGLGERVPESLANTLEGVLCTLSRILMEQAFDEKADLAAELSQDADKPSAGCPGYEDGSMAVKVSELCAR